MKFSALTTDSKYKNTLEQAIKGRMHVLRTCQMNNAQREALKLEIKEMTNEKMQLIGSGK